MRKREKRVSRLEKTEIAKKILDQKQHGEGLFLFKNKSSFASLDLPKKSHDGKKWIAPNETWEGDSYFLPMIPKEAILVKTIIDPKQTSQKTEETIMLNEENKLILDQPDQITENGKVEHVIPDQDAQINEQEQNKKNKSECKNNKNSLLTEDPLAGVTIIRD
jgi:hypothetical protein